MVKRESLSPPAPPRPRHPPPPSLDHDELDCLPSASLPIKRTLAPSSTPSKRVARPSSSSKPSPTSRPLPSPSQAASKRSASALQTPSASPHRFRVVARPAQPQPQSSPRDSGSASEGGTPKRRRTALAFKQPHGAETPASREREERARLRAQKEREQQEREEMERREEEKAQKERSKVAVKAGKGKRPAKQEGKEDEDEQVEQEQPQVEDEEDEPSMRRGNLVRGRARPPESIEVKREPSLDDDEAAVVLPVPPEPIVPMSTKKPSSSPRKRRPSPAPLPAPTHSSFSIFSASSAASTSAGHPPRPPSSTSSQIPTLASFLSTLPLPSLSRLMPHFFALGLSSPADLVQLSNSSSEAARRARGRVLERVGAMAKEAGEGEGEGGGGLTDWERIVLEEELEEGWKRWGGQGSTAEGK
ncbi:hypothetical protein JCM8547_001075 [Rhodosporidiobolus lusitaniae]